MTEGQSQRNYIITFIAFLFVVLFHSQVFLEWSIRVGNVKAVEPLYENHVSIRGEIPQDVLWSLDFAPVASMYHLSRCQTIFFSTWRPMQFLALVAEGKLSIFLSREERKFHTRVGTSQRTAFSTGMRSQ